MIFIKGCSGKEKPQKAALRLILIQSPSWFNPYGHICGWFGGSVLLKTNTARFRNLLEGLMELRKAIKPRGLVYYSDNTQTKISKGQRHRQQSLGEVERTFPVVISWWGPADSPYFQHEVLCTIHGVWLTRKSLLLWCPGSPLGLDHTYVTDHPRGWC